MNQDLLEAAERHGAESATVLAAVGARPVIDRIRARRRRRRAVSTALLAIAVPIVVLAGQAWMREGRDQVEPASDPSTEIRLDAPLAPQVRDAIENGDHDAMRALFAAGADPGATVGWDPYHYVEQAASRCDLEAVAILEGVGAPRISPDDPEVDLAVTHAVGPCEPDVVLSLLDSSPVGLTRAAQMSLVAREGTRATLLALVARGYPMEIDGEWSALLDAARSGRTSQVATLLDAGADPTVVVDGVRVDRWIATARFPEAIKELVAEASERWAQEPRWP
ncbi:hypothetical protein [Demequina gelatinilytica]|uniref:hypothetical protein n=1 Tax=Demequina gelatinilytica TaxID=1638980 RepID=UPI000784CFE8|nr:hypothetical protein [Demequina gelatinilytica]